MNYRTTILLTALLGVSALRVSATVIQQQGTLATDDQIQLINFNVVAPGLVTLQTTSYIGGGFDPVITLFDAAGNFFNNNNDGPCAIVGHDAVTTNCFDAYLALNLMAGLYTAALTENDNLAIGPTLADGFLETGNGNFSCLQAFGTPGAFCDVSPAQRNGNWAITITTPDPPANTPEPSAAALVAAGTTLIAFIRRKRRNP